MVRRRVVAIVLAGLVCMSCTSTPATSPKGSGSSSTTTATTATTATTTTSHPPSALDNLTTYFAAAEGVDQRLKAAAIVVNGDIGVAASAEQVNKRVRLTSKLQSSRCRDGLVNR